MQEFERLLTVLEREVVCQERLLALLLSEREALLKVRTEEVQKIGVEKEKLIDQSKQLQTNCVQLVQQIAPPPQTLKISELIERCGLGELRRKLAKAVMSLKQITAAVRELNRHNSVLIRQTLGLVSSTLSLLRSAPKTPLQTYSRNGMIKSNSNPYYCREHSYVTRNV